MNQDLRRMAEEAANAMKTAPFALVNDGQNASPLLKHVSRDSDSTNATYSYDGVVEAVEAALAKLTQQEPVGYTSHGELARIATCKGQFASLHKERIGSNDVAVYTHPIPSQQEERVRKLDDEQCDRIAARAMDSLAADRDMHALDLNPNIVDHHTLRRALVRSGFDAARNKEQPK